MADARSLVFDEAWFFAPEIEFFVFKTQGTWWSTEENLWNIGFGGS
jgi:glutamine synthetase